MTWRCYASASEKVEINAHVRKTHGTYGTWLTFLPVAVDCLLSAPAPLDSGSEETESLSSIVAVDPNRPLDDEDLIEFLRLAGEEGCLAFLVRFTLTCILKEFCAFSQAMSWTKFSDPKGSLALSRMDWRYRPSESMPEYPVKLTQPTFTWTIRPSLSMSTIGASVRSMYRSIRARGRPSVSLSQSSITGGGSTCLWGYTLQPSLLSRGRPTSSSTLPSSRAEHSEE